MFQIWCMNLPDVLHQNISFALFAYLKTGVHMNFYFIVAS